MYNNPIDFREKTRQKRNRKPDYQSKATQKMKSSSAGVDIVLDRDRLAKPNQSTGRQQDAEVGEGAFISGPEKRTEDTSLVLFAVPTSFPTREKLQPVPIR